MGGRKIQKKNNTFPPYLFNASQCGEPVEKIYKLNSGSYVPVHAVQRSGNAGRRYRTGRIHEEIVFWNKRMKENV